MLLYFCSTCPSYNYDGFSVYMLMYWRIEPRHFYGELRYMKSVLLLLLLLHRELDFFMGYSTIKELLLLLLLLLLILPLSMGQIPVCR